MITIQLHYRQFLVALLFADLPSLSSFISHLCKNHLYITVCMVVVVGALIAYKIARARG